MTSPVPGDWRHRHVGAAFVARLREAGCQVRVLSRRARGGMGPCRACDR
jgi:hypothetical protein